MRRASIWVQLHHIPIYRHGYYARRGHRPSSYPESERYYAEAMTLPIFPDLTDAEQDRVVDTLRLACAS
jgi:dTDP-4-amino-4,6-dideoxygalactose transaminase